MDFVRVAVQQRKVNLLALDRKLHSERSFFYELPVDGKLQEFTVSVSGQQPEITVRDPQGYKHHCTFYSAHSFNYAASTQPH